MKFLFQTSLDVIFIIDSLNKVKQVRDCLHKKNMILMYTAIL